MKHLCKGPGERDFPREHLKEHYTGRIDISGLIDVGPHQLLWRGIHGCPENIAGEGVHLNGVCLVEELGNAKIHQLNASRWAALQDENILWFDVAVDHSRAMGCSQRMQELDH